LPLKVRWWLGSLLGWLWFDVFKARRFTVLWNLRVVFPDKSREEIFKIARRSMKLLGYTLPELMTIPMLSKKFVEEEVQFHGLEHYEEALKKNKGVLLLSLHLGSGDMGISVMALKGMQVNLISKKFSNKFFNSIWWGMREQKGAKFIDAHGKKNAFEILAKLKKNEAVVFVIDQYMATPYGIKSTFFGRTTGTAYGLALFHLKTGAPVLPAYTYRDEQLRTHLVIGPEIGLEYDENQDLQISRMTEKYNRCVEQLILKHPENWMWVHRRWKKWR
jgi:KDO2-lipid IV(A) lauroyltransferase